MSVIVEKDVMGETVKSSAVLVIDITKGKTSLAESLGPTLGKTNVGERTRSEACWTRMTFIDLHQMGVLPNSLTVYLPMQNTLL